MPYHLKSNRTYRGGKRIAIIAVATVILVTIIFPGFFFTIGAFFAKGSLSVKATVVSGYEIVTSYFSGQTRMAIQNEKLRELVDELGGYRLQNDFLKQENLKLKSINVTADEYIADVIATPPQSPFSMMVITGSEKASVGDTVTSVSDIFLGTISEKHGSLAKVLLASNGGNILTVENSRTAERYEMTGKGTNNFLISVPKDTDIRKDDVMIIRKASGVYVVAKIGEIETRESSPFLFVYAVSPSSVYSISRVTVHKETNEEIIQ